MFKSSLRTVLVNLETQKFNVREEKEGLKYLLKFEFGICTVLDISKTLFLQIVKPVRY